MGRSEGLRTRGLAFFPSSMVANARADLLRDENEQYKESEAVLRACKWSRYERSQFLRRGVESASKMKSVMSNTVQ